MRLCRNLILSSIALVAVACSGQPQQGAPNAAAGAPLDRAAATITATDMYARIAFLADDALLGRNTPSPGLEVAAAYLASEFRSMGLRPAGDDGTYLQRYPFVTRALDAGATRLELRTPKASFRFELGRDFYVSIGAADQIHGPVSYAGPIIAPEAAGALRDRVVAISAPGSATRTSRMAVARARAAASAAGARALLVFLGPAADEAEIGRRAGAAGTRGSAQVPVAFLRRDAAEAVVAATGVTLDELEARSTSKPFPLAGVTALLAAPSRETDHRPPNVVAILPGSDSVMRDTYVVFSAHFDHVGVGSPDATGDSIFNGADDDASGTAAILEVAEAFASLPVAPARSLLFLGVSGEEKGLLGSRYFADHPTVPIDRIVANVNIDMIGRNAPDSIVAIGQEFSSLGALVQRVASEHDALGLTVSEDIWPEENFFFRSDHFNFARREVPAIFFFAGVHEDYHQRSDHVEKIDADKAARVARLVFWLGNAIASAPEPPRWSAEGIARVRELTR